MEFVAEVLRYDECVVDLQTQAVFADAAPSCETVSWLHPRGQERPSSHQPRTFLPRGVLPALAGSANIFYLLMEVAAGLHVLDRADVLAGSVLVGWRPDEADSRLDDTLALYGCRAVPRPSRGSRLVRVSELFVPRFWVRAAGSGTSHDESPRWAAAGYSRTFVDDLRSRLLPLPAPPADHVAYDAGPGRAVATAPDVIALGDAGAVLVPELSGAPLAASARFYAGVQRLVAVHGEANVNVVFLPDGAHVEEVFPDDETPGQFGLLADLRGLAYQATVRAGHDQDLDDLSHLLARTASSERLAVPPVYLLTGVWDNADLLEVWLAHHRAMGFAGVLAMDFGSTDGSVGVLGSSRWAGFVEVVDFPGISADHSAVLVDAARRRWPHAWGLLIDPDEFLVTPTGDLADPVLVGAMAAVDLVTVPRFHLTAARSTVLARGDSPGIADLDVRLVAQDQGKVMLDLSSGAESSLSAHEGTAASHAAVAGALTCLLHAPVRSFASYERKVQHAAATLSANPHLDAGFAWHWRRWIAIAAEGGLHDEYLRQFVADDELPRLLDDGVYVLDGRLAALARAAEAQRSENS